MCRSKTPTIGKLAEKSSKKYGHNTSVSGKNTKLFLYLAILMNFVV